MSCFYLLFKCLKCLLRFSGKYPGANAGEFCAVPVVSADFRYLLTEGSAIHFTTGSAEGKSEGSELPLRTSVFRSG